MNREVRIHVNHIGFLCRARKWFVMDYVEGVTAFEVQDMGLPANESLGGYEDWECIYRGILEPSRTDMGTCWVGDFSAVEKPGIYRIVVKDIDARSYQFMISDGAYSKLPRYFLDFIHDRRSGAFSNDWRRVSHLDDALRSDNGEYVDVSGGWYDAGDLRKWMTMSNLPAIAFSDMYERGYFPWNHFADEHVADNDWVTETAWVIPYLLKMQAPSGYFYEGVGLGGAARRLPGMTWWYENHSGCYGDNSDNRFTDNKVLSGDERKVRTDYNPMVQYITQYILLRSARTVAPVDAELARRAVAAAQKSWEYAWSAPIDEERASDLTATKAWKLLAAVELCKRGLIPASVLEEETEVLLDLQDRRYGFWYYDVSKESPYRGIQHSAQPLIALCRVYQHSPSEVLNRKIEEAVNRHWEQYVLPMSRTNPYRIIPYGCWFKPATEDYYRRTPQGLFYRFFMPDCSVQKVNHGLSGHWTSWAHGLALAAQVFGNRDMEQMAWAQLYWLMGGNQLDSCLISGVGYNNPMPHSRFHGTMVGGFCVGPRGDKNDSIVIDLDRRAEWNSTEYWNCPVANTLMAFSVLLPSSIDERDKLG